MIKPLKALTAIGAVTAALLASAPALADNDPERIWSMPMMKAMDSNKDGVVTRQEYLNYMGRQFDMMDAKKTGRLTASDFTNKTLMKLTFRTEPDAGG